MKAKISLAFEEAIEDAIEEAIEEISTLISMVLKGTSKKLDLALPWAPSTPVAAVGLAHRPARNPNFSRSPSMALIPALAPL
jgi:hypothetical protein